MQHAGQPTGGKPNSTNTFKEHRYFTFQASRFPCICYYIYGGINSRYNFYQYHKPKKDTEIQADLPSVGDSKLSPGNAGAYFDSLVEFLGKDLLKCIGRSATSAGASAQLPNYVVANMYQNEKASIGEHSDEDPLFAAMNGPGVIFSFALCRDTIFCVKPAPGPTPFATRANVSKKNRQTDWVLPIFAEENSVIVMGGNFQLQMVHHTLTHNENCERPSGPSRASGTGCSHRLHEG